MARLPQPPSAAALRALYRPTRDIVTLHPQTRLVRVFTTRSSHPQRWNSFRYAGPLPHARFDPQPPQADGSIAASSSAGVLYFGLSVRTSIAEVFQLTSIVDRITRGPYIVVFRPTRPLRLLDLTGLWPTRAGASQEISSGAKSTTRAWARTIREAHPDLDGLRYRSSMNSGDPAVCLWEPSAGDVFPRDPDVLLALNNPGLDFPLARVCTELNYTLLS
ncbi:MAG: RES family NAD+ phosphorylase [Sciscionella sp.]